MGAATFGEPAGVLELAQVRSGRGAVASRCFREALALLGVAVCQSGDHPVGAEPSHLSHVVPELGENLICLRT